MITYTTPQFGLRTTAPVPAYNDKCPYLLTWEEVANNACEISSTDAKARATSGNSVAGSATGLALLNLDPPMQVGGLLNIFASNAMGFESISGGKITISPDLALFPSGFSPAIPMTLNIMGNAAQLLITPLSQYLSVPYTYVFVYN
ncbi:MAG: hypothetical protein RLZ12_550 [Bacillota bacterium]